MLLQFAKLEWLCFTATVAAMEHNDYACAVICRAVLCNDPALHCAGVMQAKKAELEEAQQQLTEAQTELSDLQASFEQVCALLAASRLSAELLLQAAPQPCTRMRRVHNPDAHMLLSLGRWEQHSYI